MTTSLTPAEEDHAQRATEMPAAIRGSLPLPHMLLVKNTVAALDFQLAVRRLYENVQYNPIIVAVRGPLRW